MTKKEDNISTDNINVQILKKNPVGRPRKYNSPEEMQIAIDEYFLNNPFPTICGLALALGFVQRNALLTYQGYSKEFYNIIKIAKTKVEASYERDLRTMKNPTGPIFALKQFNWRDGQNIPMVANNIQINVELSPKIVESKEVKIDDIQPKIY